MAKPSSVVVWASDANVSAGPEAGQPTKVDPAGATAQGAVAGRAAPARWYNFILNHFSQWAAYLNNLHNETDFLNKQYTWLGEHTFNDALEINAIADFTVPPTFPVGFSAAGFVANPGNIGMGGPSNEVIYTDAIGVPAPRSRTVLLNMAKGTCDAGSGGVLTAVFTVGLLGWQFRESSGTVTFPIEAPRGSSLVSARVGVHNPSGGSVNFSAAAAVISPDKTDPATPFAAPIDSASSTVLAAGVAIYTLDLTPATNIDTSLANYYIEVDGQLGGKIMWVELTYLDPGPRNG